jgi:glucokinase
MQKKNNEYILAGDIGGTKTNLGIFSNGPKGPVLKVLERYPSNNYPDFESIIRQFLEIHPFPIPCACFGIAGPVNNGICNVTNLPWVVDEKSIRSRFKISNVRLINDMTATAYAIPYLKKGELYALNKGRAQKSGNMALIAPGTGLGETIIVVEQDKYIPVPAEGGHVDFAPKNEIEIGLLRYLQKIYGHVSLERILTGQGISDVHSFLISSGTYPFTKRLIKMMEKADPAMVISREALKGRSGSCVAALDMFVSILGSAAGNLALTGMTTGGIYLGGGIPPKILPKLTGNKFLASITAKGRFKAILKKIPVYVILNDKAALLGAAVDAYKIIHSKNL